MGDLKEMAPAAYYVGFLWREEEALLAAQQKVQALLGPAGAASATWDFSYTRYYQDELGESIQRRFCAYGALRSPAGLAKIKSQTNAIELELAVGGRRRVNIDPGYVTKGKVVVASTKDGTYRVCMDKGIFGQSMLYFERGAFRPWPWTYQDYQDKAALEFFHTLRRTLSHPSVYSTVRGPA